MEQNVKRHDARGRTPQTRVSSKHQVTIPSGPFRDAALSEGDTLRVEAQGAGRILLTRVEELIDRYCGCIDSDGKLRRDTAELREEWR